MVEGIRSLPTLHERLLFNLRQALEAQASRGPLKKKVQSTPEVTTRWVPSYEAAI